MLEPEQTAKRWFLNYCLYSSFGCVQSVVNHIPYFSSQSGKAVTSPPVTERKRKKSITLNDLYFFTFNPIGYMHTDIHLSTQ